MSVRLHTMTVGPIATNCYILSTDEYPEKAVVIDPGDEADAIEDCLKEHHLEPCAILLTHGHYDHILAVNPLKQRWPECELMISEDERNMVEDSSLNCQFGFPVTSTESEDGERLRNSCLHMFILLERNLAKSDDSMKYTLFKIAVEDVGINDNGKQEYWIYLLHT